MAMVAFVRGGNVGGNRFSSTAVVASLADLDAAGVGAAGTFVVRRRVSAATLRARIAGQLPFAAEVLIETGAAVLRAVERGEAVDVPAGLRRFATVMARARVDATVPFDAPPTRDWAVRVHAFEGRFALGIRRTMRETGVYPNEVIETAFAVRATTRDWPTMEKVAALLR